MEKLTENMIRWAKSKLGCTEYAGWCLAFIEDALEISNNIEVFGGDSAKESGELYKDELRDEVPERGDPEYLGWVTLERVLDKNHIRDVSGDKDFVQDSWEMWNVYCQSRGRSGRKNSRYVYQGF